MRIANDVDLVLLGGNSDKSDLAKDQVGGGIALEKGGGRILGEREERHPFCRLFVLYPGKPFDDDTKQQPVLVLVERHESYRYLFIYLFYLFYLIRYLQLIIE